LFYDSKSNKIGIPFFYFPKNWQIKKQWLTAIKRQQHRDGFEMSVGVFASVLQETDAENEAQCSQRCRPPYWICPPRPRFHVVTTTTPEMTPTKKT